MAEQWGDRWSLVYSVQSSTGRAKLVDRYKIGCGIFVPGPGKADCGRPVRSLAVSTLSCRVSPARFPGVARRGPTSSW